MKKNPFFGKKLEFMTKSFYIKNRMQWMEVIHGINLLLGAIGTVTSLLGIGSFLAKPSGTRKVGFFIGKLLKVFLNQKREASFKRFASTAEQFSEGLLEGLK